MQPSQTAVIFRQSTPELAPNCSHCTLSVGDSVVVQVWAKLHANHTKIRVTEGSAYRFVVPAGQIWTDWFIRANANGYQLGPLPFIQELFRSSKPLPDKNWFLLTGALDRPDRSPFPIGGHPVERKMTSDGELVLFANDAKSFYWNNFGRIQVIITRVL
jgi:hypothetical protein